MYFRNFIALLSFLVIGTVGVTGTSSSLNFKRVRQELEVDSEGITHVFVHVLDYNSSFELLLRRNAENIFADDHTLLFGNEEIKVQPDFMFVGTVKSYPSSHVSGSIHDDAFEGSVILNAEQRYYIENGKRLFGSDFCHKDFRFCYVIYDALHAHDTHPSDSRAKRSLEDHGLGMCGWNSKKVREALLTNLGEAYPHQPVPISEEPQHRIRRDAIALSGNAVKICNVFMQADPKLWDLFMTDFSKDEAKAREAILKQFAQIMQGVNEIYAASTFMSADGAAGPFTNFQFKIVRTAIYTTESTCKGNGADSVIAELCRDNIDSAEFLNINSKKNHDKYCLAYLMTHRQFSEGVQGLAWVGYPKSYAGGVCQRYSNINGKQSSYNTGIFTSNNYGKRSPVSSLILTVAHEMGHNFGSQHDKTECQPGGTQGNYIMYPYVTPGDRPNNKKFSSCSNDSIASNLNAVLSELTSNKKNCFTQETAAFCGNGIVEDGEQCDCGYTADCETAKDKCCVPADESGGCMLKAGVACSPSNGPCCDAASCSLFSAENAPLVQCRPGSECSEAAVCAPNSASCPQSTFKPDGTLCWENSRVCQAGECTQALCSLIRSSANQPYDSCQEAIPDGETNFERYCYLSCKAPGSEQCLNSAYIQSPGDDGPFFAFLSSYKNGTNKGQGIRLGASSPCNNFKGFCDVFYKCRNVNSQGPLASLFALLSGDQAPQTAAQWLVTYWYVVAIVAVIFVAIALVLTQIFARNCIPSSNPKKHTRRTLKESCKRTLCPCAKTSSTTPTTTS